MRHLKLALLAGAWLAWPGVVLGQTANNQGVGNDVTVNPVARGNGGTLLYPGGQYMRVVHPLLQPGASGKDTGAIHLHMPAKQSAEARKTEAAAKTPASKPARQARAEPKPEPKPVPPPAREAKAPPKPVSKPIRQARVEPPTRPRGNAVATVPGNSQPAYNPGFGTDQGAAGLNFGASAPSLPVAPPPKAQPQPRQMAKANPPPPSAAPQPSAEAPTPGLTKRSVILFAPQAADPAQSALGAIKFLAGDLSAAMTSASSRVQIQAYGGTRGDKSSDARRLSLKRALAIRQVLIDDGVPAERIDVRAMGGADDSGPADRVDVYVKA
jgi:outer membrane protein OmpA-like peptidoglycan-associated protein